MNELHASHCCAECGKEEGGGISLKTCMSCKSVKYCNPACQRSHWPTHKKDCKLRAAELRDEALFKDPPPKGDCPICFLPMPEDLISCVSLLPATTSSVPIFDFAKANEELANKAIEVYYERCGKNICRGCIHSCIQSGNYKCPFCNSVRRGKTEKEQVEEVLKRVEANDASAMCLLANYYLEGSRGVQQDHARAMELYAKVAELGLSVAHFFLANLYYKGGNLKKAKFHHEAAAMAGHEAARHNLGNLEAESGNMERAVKHWTIAASAGCFRAMQPLILCFEEGLVSRQSINLTLEAYNNSCAEMRSEARDACIKFEMGRI
jgi:tetratricopeptide (TPR) repeat protein